jgi:hypothetical protein
MYIKLFNDQTVYWAEVYNDFLQFSDNKSPCTGRLYWNLAYMDYDDRVGYSHTIKKDLHPLELYCLNKKKYAHSKEVELITATGDKIHLSKGVWLVA